MARSLRVDFPGARHHVMNRGARREPVFPDDEAREAFLARVAELPSRFGLRVHAYALMPNHYHLLIDTPRGNLSAAMRHLGHSYVQWSNRRHAWDGPLFRGRFRSVGVPRDAHWRHLLAYLHLNPVRAGLAASVDDAAWTSHRAYVGLERPEWLTVDDLLGRFGSVDGYRAYVAAVASGEPVQPEDFDPDHLWRDTTMDAALGPVPVDAGALDRGLLAVERATGLSRQEIASSKRGPGGNRARAVAGWWLSRVVGVPQVEVSIALGMSPSNLSRMLRDLPERRERDGQIGEWLAALEKDN